LKRTLLLAAALLGAIGCGGNDAGGLVTYDYASDEPVIVPSQFCTSVMGPITVGQSWMHYAIDDLGTGTDAIRTVIISDSFYSVSEKCNFPPAKAQLDVSFTGSTSGDVGAPNDQRVPADAYDFVVTCGNAAEAGDCAFNLTWSATY
jgi:hypothetical protein